MNTDISSFINSADQAAASWYNGISSGTPVITSAQQGVANQLAISQAAQLQLNSTNPGLAGLLSNPGFLFLIGLAIVGIIVFLVMR